MKKTFLSLALCSSLLYAVPAAHATDWANIGTDYNDGDSWVGGSVPPYYLPANFTGVAITQPNLSANFSDVQLSFTSGASGYNLTASPGASLTLTGDGESGPGTAIVVNGATTGYTQISAPIILAGASGTYQTFTVAGGNELVMTGQISNANPNLTLNKLGAGTLFLLGANTFTGPLSMGTTGGVITYNTIGNVGSGPSSLGAPTSAANGVIQITGNPADTLRYVGGTASTDRGINLNPPNSFNPSFTLDASGSGVLTWNGNLTASVGQTASSYSRNFWLSGLNTGNNTFAGSIQDAPSGLNTLTQLEKNGAGTWVLSGSNTFSGNLNINGGTLVVDYEHGAVINSANNLIFGNNNGGASGFTGQLSTLSQGGTLKLIGKSVGTTSQTLGNMGFYSTGANTPNQYVGQNKIIIDPNGGAGTTLTLGDAWNRNGVGLLYLELPTGATLTSSPTMNNSIIGQQNSQGWAVVKDSTGLGFATVSGGNVVRYTGATTLLAASSGYTTNYKLSGGLTMTDVAHAFNTLSVDTNPGGTLAMSVTPGNNFSASILFTGTGDYSVTGASISTNNIHQYSTGVVTIASLTPDNAGYLNIGGPGTVALASRGAGGPMLIQEGALRANGATVLSAGNTGITSGGVLELGDIGNLTATLGSGTGNIWITGDGGFSAYDSTNTGVVRTVQLNGNTNSIAWGSTYFVPNDNALVLSNVKSNTTVDFQNGLGLGSQQHLVRVADGSAKVDAVISGVLSGVYGGGLIKDGNGTLSLTGNNTYIGETWVNAGTLLVNGDQSAATGAVKVAVGATLGGTGIVGGATTISGNHNPGNSPGIQTFASDLSYTSGANVNWELAANTVTNNSNPSAVFDTIVVNGNLGFTGSTNLKLSFNTGGSTVLWADSFWASDKTGTDGWLLYELDGGGGTVSNFGNLGVVDLNWLDSAGNAFDTLHPLGEFSLYQDGNNIYLNYAAIPEPSAWTLAAFGLTALVVLRRRKIIAG